MAVTFVTVDYTSFPSRKDREAPNARPRTRKKVIREPAVSVLTPHQPEGQRHTCVSEDDVHTNSNQIQHKKFNIDPQNRHI